MTEDLLIDPAPGGSARLKGYLAVPDGAGPWPGVVVIHEALGLNEEMRRQADRLAAAGYLALAPDLFSDGGVVRCLVPTFRAMFAGRGKPLADIDAARLHLASDARCTGRIGVIGFCMGGGFALLTVATGFAAASVNYGPLPKDLRAAMSGSCPLVGSYGGKDVTQRGFARKLDGVLTDLGVEHDVREYPDAGHSFLNDEFFGPGLTHPLQRVTHLGPEPDSARDAWARIEAFFAAHLR